MSHHEQQSVASLVDEIRIAKRGMSAKNPHQRLLAKCEAAVIDLSMQLHVASQKRGWFTRFLSRRVVTAPPRRPSGLTVTPLKD